MVVKGKCSLNKLFGFEPCRTVGHVLVAVLVFAGIDLRQGNGLHGFVHMVPGADTEAHVMDEAHAYLWVVERAEGVTQSLERRLLPRYAAVWLAKFNSEHMPVEPVPDHG